LLELINIINKLLLINKLLFLIIIIKPINNYQ
jgi:hypothetical protein